MKIKFLDIKDEPWISSKAKKWLRTFLKPEMIVFEYGSGGSTIFFARRVKKIISVEYQLLWFLGVLIALLGRGITNFRLHLRRPEKRISGSKDYMSSDQAMKNISFQNFCTSIDRYPNHFFDLVFVDGRARNDCIEHAISKVKRGGYILLDDADRTYYAKGKRLVSRYKRENLDSAAVWRIDN